MTHEESKIMWKLEMENIKALKENGTEISESLQMLTDLVGKLIEDEKLLYNDYVNDLIDMSTTVLVDGDEKADRQTQVDAMCNKLIEKYSEIQ